MNYCKSRMHCRKIKIRSDVLTTRQNKQIDWFFLCSWIW